MDDMKSLMITGALAGFLLAVVVGLAAHNEWSVVLWNACLVAAACGLGLRWWTRVWIRSLASRAERPEPRRPIIDEGR